MIEIASRPTVMTVGITLGSVLPPKLKNNREYASIFSAIGVRAARAMCPGRVCSGESTVCFGTHPTCSLLLPMRACAFSWAA